MSGLSETPIVAEANSGASEMALVKIGDGTHASIERDPVTGVVCKRFRTSDPDQRADLAQREFDHLARFSRALASVPYLSCPEPVEVDPAEGKVWMTFCPGAEVSRMLKDPQENIDPDLGHLADQIAIATERYIEAFNEPYFDLATKNMLYDPSTQTLGLVDFTSRRRWRHPSAIETAFEVSLGIFLGLSVWETTHPAQLRNDVYWARQKRLSVLLLDQLATRNSLDSACIRRTSAEVYSHSARWGWPLRRPWSVRGLWYGTIGQLAFNRRRDAILREYRFDGEGGR